MGEFEKRNKKVSNREKFYKNSVNISMAFTHSLIIKTYIGDSATALPTDAKPPSIDW